MILQIAPLIDQISVLGGVVVPVADVGCQNKCPAMVNVGLSRFQKPIGESASLYHRQNPRCLENSYNLASVSRLLTTVSKITRDVRLKSRLGICPQATKNPESEFSELMSKHFAGFPPSRGKRNYAHGGKGPFRTSYQTLITLVSLRQKSHKNLSLLDFKRAARISTPWGTPLHKRAGVRARNFENDCYKL